MSDTVKRSDWMVRCYDLDDKVTARWKILDRSEHEADNEAASLEVRRSADWTLTEIVKFKLAINLDDEQECLKFMAKRPRPTGVGRNLADHLGLVGPGACKAARALHKYASCRKLAFGLRKLGAIKTALKYEKICDRIYREDILPKIECW